MNEKNKKSYTRKCIVTGQILDVSELIRFAFDKENKIVVLDLNKGEKGRGCYLKNDPNLWEIVVKKKAFNRTFRQKIETENYNQIYNQLQETLWQKK